ncbi:KGG domain-containing protein [Pseudomonas sp. Sample_10]|uniref:KGG domain-containing protein n=1 Tax=Pseudomonas sp. Sample_10 TaxID=2448269 RepID=UPI00322003E7
MSGGGQGTQRGGEFTDDMEDMNKPGQKGGQASGGRQSNEADQSTGGGQQSGRGGNFADDRDKASEAGRKGGENNGGGGRQS